MSLLLADIRLALRTFGRNPGFSAVAVLMLAVGIGANVTIFSVANALFLRPLPVAEPERLFAVKEAVSIPNFRDLSDSQQSFSSLSVFTTTPVALNDGAATDRVLAQVVSANYFETTRAPLVLGTAFLADDTANPAAVLAYDTWRTRFGSDSEILGKTIYLNARPFTVAGVAGKGFSGTALGEEAALWVPLEAHDAVLPDYEFMDIRQERAFSAIGRLRAGVTQPRASQDVANIARQLADGYPAENEGLSLSLARAGETESALRDSLLPVIILLMAVAGVVLLITCTNLAGLLLAKATARQREIAIRQALGATKLALARQWLVESLLLVIAGATGSLLLVLWSADVLLASLVASDARLDLDVDGRVVAFAAGVSALSVLLFGIGPALGAPATDLMRTLRDGASSSRRDVWLRNILVVTQISLSAMLLSGAGLFLQTLNALREVPVGFDPRNVLTFRVSPGLAGLSGEKGRQMLASIRERIAVLPGVVSVSQVQLVQLGSGDIRRPIVRAGDMTGPDANQPVGYNVAADGYFGTIGSPIVQGREFSAGDAPDASPVIIVNETLARRLFPNENAIGKRVQLPLSPGKPAPEIEIVGVARDGKYQSLLEPPKPFFYLPLSQNPRATVSFVVKTAVPPQSLVDPVRREVRSLDSNLPAFSIRTLDQYLGQHTRREQTTAAILTLCGGVALLLAAIGIHGVLSFVVARRAREIGIRLALGARPRDILMMILRQGLSLTATGIVFGTIVSIWNGKLMTNLLFGVNPASPAVMAAVAAIITAIALLATLVPALGAMRVNPVRTLRNE